MSSHDLAEVERTCERVAVVRDGRLVIESTVADLKQRARRVVDVTFVEAIPAELATVPGVGHLERDGLRARLVIEGDVNPLLSLLARYQVADVSIAPPRLEDVFMSFYEPGSHNGREHSADILVDSNSR